MAKLNQYGEGRPIPRLIGSGAAALLHAFFYDQSAPPPPQPLQLEQLEQLEQDEQDDPLEELLLFTESYTPLLLVKILLSTGMMSTVSSGKSRSPAWAANGSNAP